MKHLKLLIVAILVFSGAIAVAIAVTRSEPEEIRASERKTLAVPDSHEGDRGAQGKEHSEGTPDHEEKEAQAASAIKLAARQVELAGIETIRAALGTIRLELPLMGEITLNRDRTAQILPRVPGVIREVRSRLGDQVRAGDVMLVLESRELADATAAYLAARQRRMLAETLFAREESLWKKKISSERDFLDAKQALSEARIEERSAEYKLRALGFSDADLKALLDRPNADLTLYPVVAPFDGTVIKKAVVEGEQVDAGTVLYQLAALDKVWVIGSVYEKDIGRIKLGQPATVTVASHPGRSFRGTVTWIADTLDEKTRTLQVRVEVENEHRLLKPGMFARLAIAVEAKSGIVTLPPSSIQRQKEEFIVFVNVGGGQFERREVELGAHSSDAIEIRNGVRPGEEVVTAGSFILKSELEKEGFEAGHGH